MKDSRSPLEFVARKVRAIPKSGIRDFFDIVNTMADTVSLGVGEPGCSAPWHIRDASIYALERGATGYTSNLGLLELRARIADYLEGFIGVRYTAGNEILVTTGVSEAMDLAIRAVVDTGDEVIYHEPCYVSYRPVIEIAGGTAKAVVTEPEHSFGLMVEAVESLLTPRTKALVLNFPNNPTGAVLAPGDLEGLAELARQNDLLVISDEIYSELSYDSAHRSIASLPGMKERTLLLHGFSKAWAMTGFRLGFACGPADLIDAMMTIHQYTMLCAPTLSQVAAIEALAGAERDVEEMRSLYRRNRNYMVECLQEMGLKCPIPRGAFYAFPSIAEFGLSSRDFAMRLLETERVAVVPGNAFGPSGEGFVRCSFATSIENIKIAMSRMSRFVLNLRQ